MKELGQFRQQRILLYLNLVYLFTFLIFFFILEQYNAGLIILLIGDFLAIYLSYQSKVSFLREWSVLLTILVSYEALRFLYQPAAEKLGITNIYTLDHAFWGFNLTGFIQQSARSNILTPFMTIVYSLHIPLIIIFAIAFWSWRKEVFKIYVLSIAICTYIAFCFFLSMPTAPPWWTGVASNLLQGGGIGGTYHILSSIVESDPLAAFPSLHASYVIILMLILSTIDRRYGVSFSFIAMAVLFSTIYLGQHFLIDLIAGAILAIFSVFVADRLINYNRIYLKK